MTAPGSIIGGQAIIRDGFAKPSRTTNWRVKQLKLSRARASTQKRAETVSPGPFHDATQRLRTKLSRRYHIARGDGSSLLPKAP